MTLYSILYMTIDRYPSCVKNLVHNLAVSGVDPRDLEILWADNGSKSKDLIEALSKNSLITYKRINRENEGIARTLNQLILRAQGQYIVQLGNDYEMPQGWLKTLREYAEKVPKTGIIGIPWSGSHLGNLVEVDGHQIHLADYEKPIFGVKLKTREMLDEIGAFDEKLHPYGLEDSDYHQRAFLAGFRNYYPPNIMSKHLGSDEPSSEYRRMKDFSLAANGPYFVTKNYRRHGYFIPWPAKNEGY